MNVIEKWRLSLRKRSKNFLFDGDDKAFKALVRNAKVYAEYGVGKSSIWVLQNTQAKILAVDTSQHWIDHVKSQSPDHHRFEIAWVNLGHIGWAGRPRGYSFRNQFMDYVGSLWNRSEQPDLVLIDGRFRVACFLFSLATARPGCIILFDDYTNRPEYHLVEEYLAPTSYCGRQAKFIVPEALDRQTVFAEAQKFAYVMD